ncbi:hypothetical protein, partial [Salmonella sp. gx-f5]|uniref:hypothetical protein n=1 Tax=Salmonella sp. gx-f5 TaxID=2582605 RepID=UPI001F213DF1
MRQICKDLFSSVFIAQIYMFFEEACHGLGIISGKDRILLMRSNLCTEALNGSVIQCKTSMRKLLCFS